VFSKNIFDLYCTVYTIIFEGKLAKVYRELIIMRIGWRTNAAYEWEQHWRIAGDCLLFILNI
jgi:hypothetical protein